MLQVVGSLRPIRGPTHEPDHLLTATNVVDDSGGGVSCELTRGVKRGKRRRDAGIGHGRWVVPQTRRASVDAAVTGISM